MCSSKVEHILQSSSDLKTFYCCALSANGFFRAENNRCIERCTFRASMPGYSNVSSSGQGMYWILISMSLVRLVSELPLLYATFWTWHLIVVVLCVLLSEIAFVPRVLDFLFFSRFAQRTHICLAHPLSFLLFQQGPLKFLCLPSHSLTLYSGKDNLCCSYKMLT